MTNKILKCFICKKDIGFSSGRYVHYDNGVYNVGSRYYCCEKCMRIDKEYSGSNINSFPN